jgi:transposase
MPSKSNQERGENEDMRDKPPLPDDLSREQLGEMILERRTQLESSQAEIAELKARLGKPKKTSRNSSLPSSQTIKGRRENRRKRRGGKPGHEGKSRANQTPDHILECRAEVCPGCGRDISQQSQTVVSVHQMIDIPPVEPQVIEVRRYQAVCECGRCVLGSVPQGYDEPQQVFGAGVHSLLSYLNGTHHIAQQRLTDLMQTVFGLDLSAGALVNSLQRTARRLAAPAHDILCDIRRSVVVGSDETGLRVEGQNGWLWVVQTPQASYFAAADTRTGDVLEALMFDAVAEVWCSDLFSAQLTAPARRFAVCNAHYLRKLQYALDSGDTTFAPAFQYLLRQALHLARARDDLPPDLYTRQVETVKATAQHLLTWPVAGEDSRKLQKSLSKHFDKLWVFLDRPDVPFDNNASERALRPAVIHRKVIGGFRTEDGAAAYATYRTIEDTARKRRQAIPHALYEVLGQPFSWLTGTTYPHPVCFSSQ